MRVRASQLEHWIAFGYFVHLDHHELGHARDRAGSQSAMALERLAVGESQLSIARTFGATRSISACTIRSTKRGKFSSSHDVSMGRAGPKHT